MRIDGYYLDGKTSRRRRAYLEVNPNAAPPIRIHSDDDEHHEQVAVEYNQLRIESRLANTPREVAFANDQLFVTDDHEAIDKLIASFEGSKQSLVLHALESKLTLVIAASLITLAIIWALAVFGIPKAAETIAYKLSVFTTEDLGSGLDILDKTIFDPSALESERHDQIRALVAPYLADHQDLKPTLVFRSGKNANAFALPGGEIVFTDDFVNLAENDEELLAVFFHELGHLRYKHITRRVLQDSMVTLMIFFITGDIDTVELLTGLPTLVLDLSYSRQFENEADIYALEKMQQYDIPLERFASIMQRLEDYYVADKETASDPKVERNQFSFPDFLSTHPSTDDRVKLINQFKREY